MAETQVGSNLSRGYPFIRLGDDVVHDGLVAEMVRPGIGIELEIVGFPERYAVLGSKYVGEVQIGIQAGHSCCEEIQVGDQVPLFLFGDGLVRIIEQTREYAFVVHGSLDVLLPCLVESEGSTGKDLPAERIAPVHRKDCGQEIDSEVLHDVQSRVLSFETQAESRHGHDASGRSRCPRPDLGPVRKHVGIVGVHPRGEVLLLLPAFPGQVPCAVAHGGEQAVEAALVVQSFRGEVSGFFLR